jgi:hypothetical protein
VVKGPGREADHSPPFSSEVNNNNNNNNNNVNKNDNLITDKDIVYY